MLGDNIEAKALYTSSVDSLVNFGGKLVAEGLGPILTDMDSDGIEEVIVTLSDDKGGARPALFSLSGKLIAYGPAIGMVSFLYNTYHSTLNGRRPEIPLKKGDAKRGDHYHETVSESTSTSTTNLGNDETAFMHSTTRHQKGVTE